MAMQFIIAATAAVGLVQMVGGMITSGKQMKENQETKADMKELVESQTKAYEAQRNQVFSQAQAMMGTGTNTMAALGGQSPVAGGQYPNFLSPQAGQPLPGLG